MNKVLARSLTVALVIGCTPFAHATILTLDDLGLISTQEIPDSYGDFVSGPGGAPDGSYLMGVGWTPDVETSYSSRDPLSGETPILRFWDFGYGSLTNVYYAESNGTFARIKLTPNPGYSVTLESFSLAGWSGDVFVDQLRVLDGSDNVLWNADGTTAPGVGFTALTPNVTSEGPLILEWGANWNAGVDDVSFYQTAVPEPVSLGALALGVLGALRRRRR